MSLIAEIGDVSAAAGIIVTLDFVAPFSAMVGPFLE
jgi:hypothetical protein